MVDLIHIRVRDAEHPKAYCKQIDANIVGALAVHNNKTKHWCITHRATGYLILWQFDTRRQAFAAAKALNVAFDWTSTNIRYYKRWPKSETMRVLQVCAPYHFWAKMRYQRWEETGE